MGRRRKIEVVEDQPVEMLHIEDLSACDEHDLVSTVTTDGIEILSLAVGLRLKDEEPIYIRLRDSITIPIGNFRWDKNATIFISSRKRDDKGKIQ